MLTNLDISFFNPGVRPQVIQGMTLGNLLRVLARNHLCVDKECMGRLAYLLVMGMFNSVYGACETALSTSLIRGVVIDPPPLFILGHWRSGTTHLHNLLSLDENFTAPTAFQCLLPHHCLFSRNGTTLFNWLAPDKRPMDNMAFSANTPHEDEFALAALSTVSPYMKVLFPVTGDQGSQKLTPSFFRKKHLSDGKNPSFCS